MGAGEAHITVRKLTMAYGSFVLMRELDFEVRRGSVFIIMGPSGCGKSTLLKYLIGLKDGDGVTATTRSPASTPTSAAACSAASGSSTRRALSSAR